MLNLNNFGVNDFLFSDSMELYATISKPFSELVGYYGYDRIRVPMLSYFEPLRVGMSDDLKRWSIQFSDKLGEQLVLRFDHTISIAHYVANTPNERRKKFFYVDPVYRFSEKDVEIYQAGLEYIDLPPVEGEFEILKIVIELLTSFNIENFYIDIGYAPYLNKLEDRVKNAVLVQDYSTLSLKEIRGKAEVISEFEELKFFYERLKKGGYDKFIFFNKGVVGSHDYYTGIIFKVYVKGLPDALIVGGRYDGILSKFGANNLACGFAINMNLFQKYLMKREQGLIEK